MEFYLKHLNLKHTLDFLETDSDDSLYSIIETRELDLPPDILRELLHHLGDSENAGMLRRYLERLISKYPSEDPLERYRDAVLKGDKIEIYNAMLKVLNAKDFDNSEPIIDEIEEHIKSLEGPYRKFVCCTLQEIIDYIELTC